MCEGGTSGLFPLLEVVSLALEVAKLLSENKAPELLAVLIHFEVRLRLAQTPGHVEALGLRILDGLTEGLEDRFLLLHFLAAQASDFGQEVVDLRAALLLGEAHSVPNAFQLLGCAIHDATQDIRGSAGEAPGGLLRCSKRE